MALNAYLRLTGTTQGEIQGSVTQTGREDSIMIIAVDHLVHRPLEVDGSLGLKQHSPLVLTKELDKSSPRLWNALKDNEGITEFSLQFWRPSATGQEVQHYTIDLVNARIVGIKTEMLNNKYPENMAHAVREKVSFVYQQIVWTWVDGGISAEDSPDIPNG